MSQLIKAIGVLVLLALLVPGAEIKKAPAGNRRQGHNVTSNVTTCSYPNYSSLHNHLQQLCCDAISKYIRTQDARHLAIYDALALAICGGGSE